MDTPALVEFIEKSCPHGGTELDADALKTAFVENNRLDVYSCLLQEFVPVGDDALVAALKYEGLNGFVGIKEAGDAHLPDIGADSVHTCKAYLAHMLAALESLYARMDMTPRAMMLHWALKGALQDKPRSYGEDNCRYWNPVEAAEHDFCYELYLEQRHNFVD
jgi:hypothetical protein